MKGTTCFSERSSNARIIPVGRDTRALLQFAKYCSVYEGRDVESKGGGVWNSSSSIHSLRTVSVTGMWSERQGALWTWIICCLRPVYRRETSRKQRGASSKIARIDTIGVLWHRMPLPMHGALKAVDNEFACQIFALSSLASSHRLVYRPTLARAWCWVRNVCPM